MTLIQFLVILLIFVLGAVLIAEMITHTYSLSIIECQNMYSNMTLMKLCFEKFREEIDP